MNTTPVKNDYLFSRYLKTQYRKNNNVNQRRCRSDSTPMYHRHCFNNNNDMIKRKEMRNFRLLVYLVVVLALLQLVMDYHSSTIRIVPKIVTTTMAWSHPLIINRIQQHQQQQYIRTTGNSVWRKSQQLQQQQAPRISNPRPYNTFLSSEWYNRNSRNDSPSNSNNNDANGPTSSSSSSSFYTSSSSSSSSSYGRDVSDYIHPFGNIDQQSDPQPPPPPTTTTTKEEQPKQQQQEQVQLQSPLDLQQEQQQQLQSQPPPPPNLQQQEQLPPIQQQQIPSLSLSSSLSSSPPSPSTSQQPQQQNVEVPTTFSTMYNSNPFQPEQLKQQQQQQFSLSSPSLSQVPQSPQYVATPTIMNSNTGTDISNMLQSQQQQQQQPASSLPSLSQESLPQQYVAIPNSNSNTYNSNMLQPQSMPPPMPPSMPPTVSSFTSSPTVSSFPSSPTITETTTASTSQSTAKNIDVELLQQYMNGNQPQAQPKQAQVQQQSPYSGTMSTYTPAPVPVPATMPTLSSIPRPPSDWYTSTRSYSYTPAQPQYGSSNSNNDNNSKKKSLDPDVQLLQQFESNQYQQPPSPSQQPSQQQQVEWSSPSIGSTTTTTTTTTTGMTNVQQGSANENIDIDSLLLRQVSSNQQPVALPTSSTTATSASGINSSSNGYSMAQSSSSSSSSNDDDIDVQLLRQLNNNEQPVQQQQQMQQAVQQSTMAIPTPATTNSKRDIDVELIQQFINPQQQPQQQLTVQQQQPLSPQQVQQQPMGEVSNSSGGTKNIGTEVVQKFSNTQQLAQPQPNAASSSATNGINIAVELLQQFLRNKDLLSQQQQQPSVASPANIDDNTTDKVPNGNGSKLQSDAELSSNIYTTEKTTAERISEPSFLGSSLAGNDIDIMRTREFPLIHEELRAPSQQQIDNLSPTTSIQSSSIGTAENYNNSRSTSTSNLVMDDQVGNSSKIDTNDSTDSTIVQPSIPSTSSPNNKVLQESSNNQQISQQQIPSERSNTNKLIENTNNTKNNAINNFTETNKNLNAQSMIIEKFENNYLEPFTSNQMDSKQQNTEFTLTNTDNIDLAKIGSIDTIGNNNLEETENVPTLSSASNVREFIQQFRSNKPPTKGLQQQQFDPLMGYSLQDLEAFATSKAGIASNSKQPLQEEQSIQKPKYNLELENDVSDEGVLLNSNEYIQSSRDLSFKSNVDNSDNEGVPIIQTDPAYRSSIEGYLQTMTSIMESSPNSFEYISVGQQDDIKYSDAPLEPPPPQPTAPYSSGYIADAVVQPLLVDNPTGRRKQKPESLQVDNPTIGYQPAYHTPPSEKYQRYESPLILNNPNFNKPLNNQNYNPLIGKQNFNPQSKNEIHKSNNLDISNDNSNINANDFAKMDELWSVVSQLQSKQQQNTDDNYSVMYTQAEELHRRVFENETGFYNQSQVFLESLTNTSKAAFANVERRGRFFRERQQQAIEELYKQIDEFETLLLTQQQDQHQGNETDTASSLVLCSQCKCRMSVEEVANSLSKSRSTGQQICRVCYMEQLVSKSKSNDYRQQQERARTLYQTYYKQQQQPRSSPGMDGTSATSFSNRRKYYSANPPPNLFGTIMPPLSSTAQNKSVASVHNSSEVSTTETKHELVEPLNPVASSKTLFPASLNDPTTKSIPKKRGRKPKEEVKSDNFTLTGISTVGDDLQNSATNISSRTTEVAESLLSAQQQSQLNVDDTQSTSSVSAMTNEEIDNNSIYPWIEMIDPDTDEVFYWNEETEEMRWEL